VIADTPLPPDPPADFDACNPLRADAVRISGTTRRGKKCELVDNTGRGLPMTELRALLDALVAADRFGFAIASAKGGATLALDRRESGHVQIGDDLYRLVIHRYQGRLEPF
jgi:hypothetical protein